MTAKKWLAILVERPSELAKMYNRLIHDRSFRRIWKKTIFLKKPGVEGNTPGCIRHRRLLSSARKLYERIVAERLMKHIKLKGG